MVAALAVGALVGGVSGAGVTLWATGDDDSVLSGSSTPESITINNPDEATVISAVAAKAGPSVVTLSVTDSAGNGTGSGVVIDDEGHILTNTHVVTLDGATASPEIQVQTYDGRLLSADLIGTDPMSDLAVIKVEATDLPAIEFADSSELNVGDIAVAIGAPLGLANTVTDGIISALNRSITVASSAAPETPDETTPDQEESPFDFWNFDIPGQEEQRQQSSTISLSVIQTDASINPGNSGGALLDDEGRLIGINVAIASTGASAETAGSIGVGFAIPANLAQRVATEIIENGEASHGLLGAMVSETDGTTLGALIAEVTAGGAADEAGLRAGDVVTAVNDVPITSPSDLTAQVRALPAGATAEIVFQRDGETHSVEVTLGALE